MQINIKALHNPTTDSPSMYSLKPQGLSRPSTAVTGKMGFSLGGKKGTYFQREELSEEVMLGGALRSLVKTH